MQKLFNISLAVYEWDTASGRRTGEYVLKNCSYTGIAINPDARNIFAVGSDRKLKEISDSQVSFFFPLRQNILQIRKKMRLYCLFV